MASASFICRPTLQSCSRPKPFGRSSTSRSSTNTWQPSTNSTQKSPANASPLPNSPNKSNRASASIGGQSQSIRFNYPESVSQLVCLPPFWSSHVEVLTDGQDATTADAGCE